MLLRLMLLIPLLRQFMLLEELCELDGPVWVSNSVNSVKEHAKTAARRVPWNDRRTVFTSANIRLRLGPLHKLVSRPVFVLDVAHGSNTFRYYLTRRGKLYQGYPQNELNLVDPTTMSPAERAELNRALDATHRS